MELFSRFLVVATLWVGSAFSVVLTEQVLSSVIYTMYGDRTPYILPQLPTLTPFGAQQLYTAGASFRNRYIMSQSDSSIPSTAIAGLGQYELDNSQIEILSTDDQYIVASALAFMQGLYPPLGDISDPTSDALLSMLANGTNIQAPLNGFQYPEFQAVSENDPDSIWVAGMDGCPEYLNSTNEYWKSEAAQFLITSEADFYKGLESNILGGIFPDSGVGYFDAYEIWDYVNYGVIHNSSIANSISSDDLTKLRLLADNWAFALNGNTTGPAVMAGRTLASKILLSIFANVQQTGGENKMTMLFGRFEPMMSLAALLGLSSMQQEIFYSIPEMGSSMVFELIALIEDGNEVGYPSDEDLFVRFFYQNGTDEYSSFVNYPLFGLDPDQTMVSLADFQLGMEAFMILNTNWCTMCASESIFCPAFEEENGSSGASSGQASSGNKLNPAIAGVIGALVTLVVLALIVGAAMLLLGLRFFRVKNKRRSELAGFKGAEKLASDQDLTIPKGGAGAVVTEGRVGAVRGHERVGSWELHDSKKVEEGQNPIDQAAGSAPRRPSYDDDDLHVTPYASPVKTNEHV